MNIPNKTTGDSYTGAEFTQFKNESQNAILASGQSLANNDVQLKQALARYASAGSSFTENGIANAYNLIAKGSFDLVTTYQDGATYLFTTANANTGNSTLSINGLPAKAIKRNGNSLGIFIGDIIANEVNIVQYNSSDDSFELINAKNINPIISRIDDMSNGGANDLFEFEYIHDSSWDQFDYLTLEITNAITSGAGQIGFVVSANATPTTWPDMDSTARNALCPTDNLITLGESMYLKVTISNNSIMKSVRFDDLLVTNQNINSNDGGPQLGFALNYNGTTLSSTTNTLTWVGWSTTDAKWTDYRFKFLNDVGNYTSGTITLRGHKL